MPSTRLVLLFAILMMVYVAEAKAGSPQKGEADYSCKSAPVLAHQHCRCPEPPRAGIVESVPIRRLGRDPEEDRGERDLNDMESRVKRLEDMIIKLVAAVEMHIAQPHGTKSVTDGEMGTGGMPVGKPKAGTP